jgi:RNA polymerase sigma-70 factor (ECF subfamily)
MTALSPHLALAAPLEGERGDPPSASGVHASPRHGALPAPPAFEAVYEELFDFVWRSLRRLGVTPAGIDDAVQDVFIVVHRRLPEFAGRSSLKTWVLGIALRVARDHQRSRRRKGDHEELDARIPDAAPGPVESLARAEALRELDRILSTLDEDKRAVFVLAEIEELTAPEIAEALEINVNTVYSRLRAARRAFDAALAASRGGAP